MALSRDIPGSLRWIVNPIVSHMSIDSLKTTLRQTRDAVDTQQVAEERRPTAGRKGLN